MLESESSATPTDRQANGSPADDQEKKVDTTITHEAQAITIDQGRSEAQEEGDDDLTKLTNGTSEQFSDSQPVMDAA